MSKQISLFFVFLFCWSIAAIGQDKFVYAAIDSLRQQYSLYQNEYPEVKILAGERLIPLSPLSNEYSSTLPCIEAYNIPPEIFLEYYPWNADSISVSIDKSMKLGILDKEHLLELLQAFYNYDVKQSTPKIYTFIDPVLNRGVALANFSFTFHHNNRTMKADFYQHGENRMRILDYSLQDPYAFDDKNPYTMPSSSSIFWGSQCDATYKMIKDVIGRQFNTSIGFGKYEMDDNEDDDLELQMHLIE